MKQYKDKKHKEIEVRVPILVLLVSFHRKLQNYFRIILWLVEIWLVLYTWNTILSFLDYSGLGIFGLSFFGFFFLNASSNGKRNSLRT